ncbi:autotransporter-associated beta strand repeat-containing protein [Candidatus Omnitrophota bacterium]
MNKQKLLIIVIGLMIAVMSFGAGDVLAVARQWNGGTNAWLTTTNWTPAGTPAADDDLTIVGGVTQPVITVAGALCNSITFNSVAGATTLTITNPGSLTPTSGATISSAAASAANAATINGTGAITALGTLTVNNSASSGGLLTISVTGDFTGNGSNAIAFTGSQNITVSSVIAGGSVPVNINMDLLTDVVTFSGANTYAGITTINTGMLTTSAPDKIADTSKVNIAGPAANAGLTIGGNETIGALSGTGDITIAAFTLTVSQTSNTTYSGIIGIGTTAGALTKSGSGTLTLTGANLYTGATTINAGKINAQNNTALGTTAGGVVVAANAGLQLQGGVTVGAEALTLNAGTATELESVSGTNSYAGAITLSGACEIVSTLNTLTVSNTIGGGDVTFGGAGDITTGGVIGGGAITVTKIGAGTLTLGNAVNTYTGVTTISAGIVKLQNTSALGGVGGGTTVASGATLQLNLGGAFAAEPLTINGATALENLTAAGDWAGPITLGANAEIKTTGAALIVSGTIANDVYTLTCKGDNNITLSGIIGGAGTTGGLTVAMDDLTDVVTLSGANTYTGTTTITKGRITTSAADKIANTSHVNIAGATADAGLTLGGNETIGGLEGSGDITLAAFTLTVDDQGNSYTYSGVFGFGATDANLVKQGAGTLTLSGANVHTGTILISAGKIKAANANALGSIAAGDITTVTNGATLQYSGGIAFAAELLTLNGGTSLENLDGTNSMAGAITLGVAANTIKGTAGTLTLGGANVCAQDLTFDVASGATIIQNGIISAGGGTVTKTGDGTLQLTANNAYITATTISAGTVTISHANGLGTNAGGVSVASGATLQLSTIAGAFDTEALTLDGGTLENLDAANTWAGTVLLSASSTIKTTSGVLTVSGATTMAAWTLTLQGADDITYSGVIGVGATAGNLTVDMAALYTVTLSAVNLYTGDTTITGGNLTTSAAGRIDDASDVILADAAIAKLTLGGDETIANLSGGGTSGGDIDITGTLTVTQTSDLTYGGDITGAALTKAGAGKLTLTGTNSTYSGALTIAAGTLNMQHASAPGLVSGGVSLTAGASLELQGGVTFGAEALTLNGGGGLNELVNVSGDNTWAGTIATAAGAIDIKSTLNTLTLSGAISGTQALNFNTTGHVVVSGVIGTGAGTVTKTGTGTLQLDGVNTYTGATSINGGTLAGTGTVASAITMANATTLAPGGTLGTAVGTFTSSYNTGGTAITFNGESKYEVTVTGTTPDKIVVLDDITATGSTPNVEIQSGYVVTSLTLPATIIDMTGGGGAYTAFDESQLPTGFDVDNALFGNLIRITVVPIVTAPTFMSITVAPANVPKGAYVNGGGVAANDNHYWQSLKISLGQKHPDCGVFTLYLPTGMNVADSDGDGNLSDEVSLVYEDADNLFGVKYYATNAAKTQMSFVYYSGTDQAFPDGDEVINLMFPVETDATPASSTDDYYISFGNSDPLNPTYRAATLDLGAEAGGIAASSVGDYIKGTTSGTIGVIAAQEADVDGTNEYLRVVYSGGPFVAENIDVVASPEAAYVAADYDITSVSQIGPTDVEMGLEITDGDAASYLEGSYMFSGAVNQDTPCALIISSLDKTGVDSLYVAFSGALFEVADAAVEDIGPAPNTWKGAALVDGSDISSVTGALTYAPDDIANGSGPSVTFKTPGPNAIALVSFLSNMTGHNDSTSTYGEMFPTTAASTYGALPDLVVDGTGDGNWSGANFASGTFFTLDNTEDGNETPYYLWASQDSTLALVQAVGTGAYRLTTTAGADYSDDEAGTGGTQYDTTNLAAGDWYFYITSPLSGGWSLARSGKLTVRHSPYVKLVGWDYDDVGAGAGTAGYDESGNTDDENVTLDSGSYFQYDGTINDNLHTRSFLNFYLKVVDYDDNAKVKIFFSTITDLDATKIDVTHAEYATKGALLTGATAVKDTILYENEVTQAGYLKLYWDIHPDQFGSVITASDYTVYAVADDGKTQSILASKGSEPLTTEVVKIKHSPNLTLDLLTEYDSVPGTTTSNIIDVSQHDTIMLSWGKGTGVLGDMDADDSGMISLFLDVDTGTDGLADYNSTDADQLAIDGGVGTTTIKLTDGISEDDDSKTSSYYAWNIKDFYASSGWSPTAGLNYHLYAIIDENKEGGTKRVVGLGDGTDGLLETTDNLPEISFLVSNPFVRLIDPPADGVSVNAEETYKLRFSAFDWDSNANIGIFLVKTGSGSAVLVDGAWGANKIYSGFEFGAGANAYGGMLNMSDNEVVCLTSSDGSLANGSWLSENTATDYDFTISLPSTGKVYSKDVNDDGTGIANGDYWVYIGVDDGSYDSVTLSLTSSAAFNVGDYIVGGTSGALGLVTADLGSGDLTVYRSDTAFTNGESVDKGTVYVSAETTVNAAEASVVSRTGFSGGVVPLYRAPGTLTVINSSATPAQRNLSISPTNLTIALGDTASYTIKGADNGSDTIDRVDAFIAVNKTYWSLVNSTSPFTGATEYTSAVLVNSVIDDAANNRWILRLIIDNGGTDLTVDDSGLGENIATFKLVSKGTSAMAEESTIIEFLNEGSYRTKFSDGGVNVTVNTLGSSVTVQPRGLIKGIVELEGRSTMQNIQMTFELRERGSYENITDTSFYTANDVDSEVAGAQVTIDNVNGNFVLTSVPTGEYDLVATYNRYLAKLIKVEVYPGIDTLSVSFGTLSGGDCAGYTDSLGVTYPDNQIGTEDKNRVRSAFLATSADGKWDYVTNPVDSAKVNWKWADINEDGVVEEDDLSMITKNINLSGAQPVYKAAGQSVMSNLNSQVEFTNIPSELKAGETYTIQVVASNTADVRTYFVNLNYDSSKLDFEGIMKGDFFINDSYSFPVVKEGFVGLANSTYGYLAYSGDGVLAEVTFTAKNDGVFTPDMLGVQKASFVNSAFMKEQVMAEALVELTSNETPAVFSLGQNFPNPFNPTTNINFTLPEASNVTLKIYDILGHHIDTLVDNALAPGNHSVMWDAIDRNGKAVSAGVYFYTIDAGSFHSTKKMLLMK